MTYNWQKISILIAVAAIVSISFYYLYFRAKDKQLKEKFAEPLPRSKVLQAEKFFKEAAKEYRSNPLVKGDYRKQASRLLNEAGSVFAERIRGWERYYAGLNDAEKAGWVKDLPNGVKFAGSLDNSKLMTWGWQVFQDAAKRANVSESVWKKIFNRYQAKIVL